MCIRHPECSVVDNALTIGGKLTNDGIKAEIRKIREHDKDGLILNHLAEVRELIRKKYCKTLTNAEIGYCLSLARKYTNDDTHQAMEAVVHNLNSMHSRAGRGIRARIL